MNKKTVRAALWGRVSPRPSTSRRSQKVHGANVEIKGVYALEGAEAYAQKRGYRRLRLARTTPRRRRRDPRCATASAHEPIAIAGLERDKFVIAKSR